MTKDVIVTMKGMQFSINEENGDNESIEIITTGQYYERNGHSFLMYDEMIDGVEKPVSNLVKYDSHLLEVTKKGMINVHMYFEEGKQNLTDYHTPYGDIVIGITTNRVQIKEDENRIHIEVDYALDVNYEFLSDCKIWMEITPKNHSKRSIL